MSRAVLCVGLRGGNQIAALAPRLVHEDGTVLVAGSLSAGPPTLAQRVTYLASMMRGPGVYDCEVEGETIIPALSPLLTIPDFARQVFSEHAWIAPTAREPAKVKRSES